MSFFIPAAYAQAAPAAAPASQIGPLVLMVGFILIFYFMIWRPQAKQKKERNALLDALQKGDEVVTNGGIVGRVTKVVDDFVILEVSDKLELKFQKSAVSATLPKGTIKALQQ